MKRTKLLVALAAMLALSFTALSCSSESGGGEDGNVTTKGSYPVRSVTAGATSASVVFAWSKPSDTSNYGGVKITWESKSKSEIVDSSKTSHTVTGLSASTDYKFEIITLDKNSSETTSSVSLSITTPAAQTVAGDDTIAPADVSSLSAKNLDGAVLLTWTDPADEDLFGIQITYTENSASRALSAMEEGSIFVAPGTQSATVTGLANGTSYTFTVKAMDTSGNKSGGATAMATPAVIQGNAMQITLTPDTTEVTNKDVSVGIAITTDASSVTTVKYASGEQNVSYFASKGVTLSADDNGAYSFEASENGTYTVYVLDSDGRCETQIVTISNIDKTAPNAVSSLYASYDNSAKKISVTWTTADTDVDRYLVSYSVDDEAKVTDASVSDAAYTVESVETDSGTYSFTVKAVDKAGNIGATSEAKITPTSAPVFTSFTIPNAGTSKEDNTVTATVIGKNFTAPNITSSSFTVACSQKASIASGSTVTIVSDSKLTVTLTIPGTAGVYAVTVASGNTLKEGTFTVKDYSDYTVGKIVLADGTLVESSSYTAIGNANPPVAVIAGFNDSGAALGVGLHTSSGVQWAPSGTTGYNTSFTDIVCTPSVYWQSGAADTATFTGDTDGSDNWSVICSKDSKGSAEAATNYPAFNWANNYGETYKDYLGSATEGWYMPSLAELCYVYRNREAINATLAVINGLGSSYAQSSLGTSKFWSSSQDSYYCNYAWTVNFSDGGVYSNYKGKTNGEVVVVRAF